MGTFSIHWYIVAQTFLLQNDRRKVMMWNEECKIKYQEYHWVYIINLYFNQGYAFTSAKQVFYCTKVGLICNIKLIMNLKRHSHKIYNNIIQQVEVEVEVML